MPQIVPWGLTAKPLRGTNLPNTMLVAGSFTTDSNGNVTSVSGLAPGISVSGTNLASGIYTCYFGDGPNVNQVAGTSSSYASSSTNSFLAGGAPTVGSSFARVLYLSAEVCKDNTFPTIDFIQATMRDGLAASGQLQYMSQGTVALASGVFKTGPAVSRIIQVIALLSIHQDIA